MITKAALDGAAKDLQSVKTSHQSRVFEGGRPEMRTLDELRTRDPTSIYCIGDNTNILKFDVGPMCWSKIPYENDARSKEAFDGTLRYTSSCFVPPAPEALVLVTGGCQITNGFPTGNAALFPIKNIRHPQKLRPMLLKRYGHSSCYMNGIVYCIGGFSHKDLPNE